MTTKASASRLLKFGLISTEEFRARMRRKGFDLERNPRKSSYVENTCIACESDLILDTEKHWHDAPAYCPFCGAKEPWLYEWDQ